MREAIHNGEIALTTETHSGPPSVCSVPVGPTITKDLIPPKRATLVVLEAEPRHLCSPSPGPTTKAQLWSEPSVKKDKKLKYKGMIEAATKLGRFKSTMGAETDQDVILVPPRTPQQHLTLVPFWMMIPARQLVSLGPTLSWQPAVSPQHTYYMSPTIFKQMGGTSPSNFRRV